MGRILTVAGVKSLQRPGRYTDGTVKGLHLHVDGNGYRRWVLRVKFSGRRRDIGLGGFPDVGLAEARQQAEAMRQQIRLGLDPIAERQKARTAGLTFEQAARACHAEQEATWKNRKHAAQWLATLESYAFPQLGRGPVAEIDGPSVREVLLAIWLDKPETARRVRQRIGAVLNWAFAKGLRDSEAPMAAVSKGLPRQRDAVRHMKAMPYADVPAFLQALRATDKAGATVKQAFAFLILTAARSGEVRGARWTEIDLEGATWTIPAERMKAGKAHTVPLTDAALEVLAEAKALARDGQTLIFEGAKPGKALSDMALTMLLRRMEVDATAHGFRSAFRDFAAERTSFPREAAELCLAHAVGNAVERAYRRSDLLERRRALMEAWAGFLAQKAGNVVPIARKRGETA